MTIMTVFEAAVRTEDGQRWLRVRDQRSGDIWDEPAGDWEMVIGMMAHDTSGIGRHYRHKSDGRVAKPID